ncbi:ABC transporter transmembrane domain-containing protein [Morganella morganii]|uniref:ABC transporter transmembrane domain-containing protein n=1 Tax=Morganella morganii TaxID=582 RepID=UPI00406B98E4
MMKDIDISTRQTFRRLWPTIAPFKTGIIVAAIALVINAGGDAFMLSLLKPLLDEGFGTADNDFLRIMPLIILGLMLLRGISSFVSGYCLSWVSGKVVMTMRRNLFRHMMGMPVSFFDQQSTGTLLSRITYDSEQVASSSSGALVTVVREGAYIIALFGLMFYNSWQLSLILIVIAPIVAFVIRKVSVRFREISKNMQSGMGQVSASAEQMLKGHKEVLIFGGQKVENDRFDKVSNHMRRQGMKLVTASSIADPIIQIIASFALAFVLFAASFPEIKEALSAGSITVVFSSMIALMRPLKSLTNVNAQFQRGMAACQTLFVLLDMEQEKDTGTKVLKDAKGDVAFENVTFRYQGKENPALKNVSFTIPSGKTVALVGRSGSGKSTIANLKIEKAAEMAYAMDFINKMEKGLDTEIGENGVLLSGGQRQRIAIARALLRDAPILILDEATSALDTESERAIQAALDELQKNRTCLVIAHRLSTIEKADEILVVQDGEVQERGTHDELVKQPGIYAQLYNMQFGH